MACCEDCFPPQSRQWYIREAPSGKIGYGDYKGEGEGDEGRKRGRENGAYRTSNEHFVPKLLTISPELICQTEEDNGTQGQACRKGGEGALREAG